MSEVSDSAAVRILVADYIAIDGLGKLNVIGGNITAVGLIPLTGLTAPFGISVHVSVPPNLYNSETALEVLLEDSSGNPMQIPGPTGETQILRIAQNVTLEEKNLSQIGVPRKTLWASFQWALMFGAGLPLPVGQRYVWRVKLDHATQPAWASEIFVPGAPPGPVLG